MMWLILTSMVLTHKGALFPTPKQVTYMGLLILATTCMLPIMGTPAQGAEDPLKMSSLFEMGTPCGYPYARRALRSTKCDR